MAKRLRLPESSSNESNDDPSVDLAAPPKKKARLDAKDTAVDLLKQTASAANIVLIPEGIPDEARAIMSPVLGPEYRGFAALRIQGDDPEKAWLRIWPRTPLHHSSCAASLIDELVANGGRFNWRVISDKTAVSVTAGPDAAVGDELSSSSSEPTPVTAGPGCAWWSGKRIGLGKRCGVAGTPSPGGVELCDKHRCRKCRRQKAQNGGNYCRACYNPREKMYAVTKLQ